MNFFSRKVQNSIHALINGKEFTKDEFTGVEFREIDFSIIYMFKMYQGTQDTKRDSLINMLATHYDKMSFIIFVEIIVMLGVGGFGVFFFFLEQEKVSKLSGTCTLIPTIVVKVSKHMIKNLTRIVNLDDSH